MVVSIEERQAISRRNGAKSRGPVTDAGKLICSANSIKHGFYAKVHSLPDECPVETARLRERWFADMAPRSIDEEFLTNELFQANLMANRVHRARSAQLTTEQNAATKSWHDERDHVVGELWKELLETHDAKDILVELQTSTLGIQRLSQEWSRLKALLQDRGYWLSGELHRAVVMSGCRWHEHMLFEDEDAYRLCMWNFRCESGPSWEKIEHMLEPAHRPPALRDVDVDVLVPEPAECLERLIQWADDVLQELHDDYERVWTEIEAPQLARRTNPKAIVTEVAKEKQLHRASSEYRATYYKAHNALEAIRKRRAAEEKEARKNADRADSRRSDGKEESVNYTEYAERAAAAKVAPAPAPPGREPVAAPNGRVGPVCDPEVGPQDGPSPETETPVVAEVSVPVAAPEAGPQDGPSSVAEPPVMAEVSVPMVVPEIGPQDGPSSVAEPPVMAEVSVPLVGARRCGPQDGPSLSAETPVLAGCLGDRRSCPSRPSDVVAQLPGATVR